MKLLKIFLLINFLSCGLFAMESDEFDEFDSLGEAILADSVYDVGRLLEAGGIDLNVRDERNRTPLMLAVDKNNFEMVKVLIEKGGAEKLDIDAQDDTGYTALMRAAERGNADIIKLLLSRGARLDIINDAGKKAADLAIGVSFDDLVKEQEALNDQFLTAVSNGKKGEVEALLRQGAYINAEDVWGDTALFLATTKGYEDIVELLLERGADPLSKNDNGETALDLAKKGSDTGIIELLESWPIPLSHMVILYDRHADLSDTNYSLGTNTVLSQNIKALISKGGTPFLVNGAMALVLLYFIIKPSDESFTSQGMIILRRAIQSLTDEGWDFYVIYEPAPFVLFIPKKYLETHPSTGINLKKMEKFEQKDVQKVGFKIKNILKESKKESREEDKRGIQSNLEDKAAQTILSLFEKYDPQKPMMWNILLYGHGMTSIKHGLMPAGVGLKESGASIAGLPFFQFIRLIDGLRNKVKLNVTSWVSCYGGGLNAEALQKIINISKRVGGGFESGILLSAALADESIQLGNGEKINFEKAFNYFDLMRSGVSSVASIMKNASNAIRELGLSDFASGLIFIPEEGQFVPLNPEFKGRRGTVFNLSQEKTDSIVLQSPSADKIKLLVPGEMAKQEITEIKSEEGLKEIFREALFDANKGSAFSRLWKLTRLRVTQWIVASNNYLKVLWVFKLFIM